MGKKVLVTGASSGFGMLTVKTLLQQGHEVVGTMRDIKTRNKDIEGELSYEGAKIIEMDVTDTASVNHGIAKAIQRLGSLDVVVNNAGIGVIGMQEHFTIDDFQKLFDVNVFGVQRVARAILPHFREKHTGLMIFVSSILGRMSIPFYGPYNASKWAVEALAENYKVELSAFGIDSCIVEPGGYPTAFNEHLIRPSDHSRDVEYGDFMNAPQKLSQGMQQNFASHPEQNPQNVADAIAKLINTPAGKRAVRTIVDNLGMGDPFEGYNAQLDLITHNIYNAFGMGSMLDLKV